MHNKIITWFVLATLLPFSTVLNDSPRPWQIGFQDPATPIMEGIIHLHHHIFFFIVLIVTFVAYMLIRVLVVFARKKNLIPLKTTHSAVLEIVWTLTPSIILMLIAVPSFALLYAMDDVVDPAITIKAIGHQWYWSYEYSDYTTENGESLAFDSYMIPEEDLTVGQLRLLEVDNRVILPTDTHIRVIVTSTDVIHSWAVPSLGIKIDAVPGRLNQVSMLIKREGIYYGQCSEICGVNHGFMPIAIEAVSLDNYVSWVSDQLTLEA